MHGPRFVWSTLVAALLFTTPLFAETSTIRLFDGETLSGWTTQSGDPVTRRWEVVDGLLHLNPNGGGALNILTEDEYGDFELSFEWKIPAGANNGVKYRVRAYDKRILGCEYQMIDDTGYKKPLPATGTTGALYDIYEPDASKILNPVGEFNHSRIVVRGNRIEHWLNGRLVVVACVGSCEWNRRIAESKFADIEGFGRNRVGKIMLTDHQSEAWYRSIELTPLPPARERPSGPFHRARTQGPLRRLLQRLRR